MKRRSRAGPERAKSRRRKTITQKRRRVRNPSTADHKTQSDVALLTRERDEALEREKATAEVLRVISGSPAELEPVFQTMLENATRICDAKFGTVFQFYGEAFHLMAMVNTPPALTNFLQRRGRFVPEAGNGLYRVWKSKKLLHTLDDAASPVP